MTDKNSEWQDKARQYLRAEKKQLEEEKRDAEIIKQRDEKKGDSSSEG